MPDMVLTGRLILDPSGVKKGADEAARVLGGMGQAADTAGTQLGGVGRGARAAGQGFHRGNLFMLNFSRGLEDLKFGLPAVINNLDSISFSFQLMQNEAKAAGTSVRTSLWQGLKSPAGILAGVNAIITAFVLLGDKIDTTSKKVKGLQSAFEEMLEVEFDFPEFKIGGEDLVTYVARARNEVLRLRLSAAGPDPSAQLLAATGLQPNLLLPGDIKSKVVLLDAFIKAYGDTADKISQAQRAVEYLNSELGLQDTRLTDAEKALNKLRETITTSSVEWGRLTAAASDLWSVLGGPDELGRMKELQGQIRALTEHGISPASDEIQRLRSQLQKLAEDLNFGAGRPSFVPLWQNTIPGQRQQPGAPTELTEPKWMKGRLDALKREREAVDEVANAFSNRLNAAIKETSVSLRELPVDAVMMLSSSLGDAVGDLITFQGGLKDFGQSIVRGLQRMIAHMASLIIQQKILNALKADEARFSGLSAIGALGGGGLGFLAPLLGGLGVASLLFGGGSRPVVVGSQQIGGSSSSTRGSLQVQSTVLRSGDLRISVRQADAVAGRLGQ